MYESSPTEAQSNKIRHFKVSEFEGVLYLNCTILNSSLFFSQNFPIFKSHLNIFYSLGLTLRVANLLFKCLVLFNQELSVH